MGIEGRKNSTARVSIVTISFNQAQYVERAIRSVLEQDYPAIEYLVVDAGSTDGSRAIIQSYPQISRMIFAPDKGPADGLNKGFAAATGDIFGYINSDDAYLPGAIRKAVATFQSNPNADVVYGHSYLVDGAGGILRRSRSVPFDLRRYAYGGVVVMQQSTFFRARAFERVGGFNEANSTSWDGELLVDLARRGARFVLVNDYWSKFAIYPGSLSSSAAHNPQYREDHARMFRIITGKDYHQAARLKFILAGAEKWVRNPAATLTRVVDTLTDRFCRPSDSPARSGGRASMERSW